MRDVIVNEYAVLVPFVTTEGGEALLLEIRSENVRQPGEICFPGGRVEPGETAEQAAVRETCEELGLRPGDIDISGEAELEVLANCRKIWSVRGRIAAESLRDIKLSGAEVADVFLLPVRWLAVNPPSYYDLGIAEERELPDILREYLEGYDSFRRTGKTYYWEYEGHGIWGLTARIIKNHNEYIRKGMKLRK